MSLTQRHQLIEILEALTQGLAEDARAPFVPLLPPEATDSPAEPAAAPKARANRTNTGQAKAAQRR